MVLLIKNGNIVDVINNKIIKNSDILIDKGKIIEIKKDIIEKSAIIIDAKNKLVCPGFIDMHVHLREPGFEHKETIQTGAKAAAAGGFTTIVCMPNTKPVTDNSGLISLIKEKAKAVSINVFPAGAITKESKGDELAEIGDMVQAGAIAITDDGKPVSNSEVMRCAMEYSKMFEIPILSHCEDLALSNSGVMNEGFPSTILGLKGIPNQSESIIVARDVLLAELTGACIHIQHVSTRESVLIIKTAKKRGVKVTAETTPHYISLSDEDVNPLLTSTKVNPPLRSKQDIKAVKAALLDGTIDVLATDHAPHSQEEKDLEFNRAPFGINGLETAVGVVFNELCQIANEKQIINIIKKFTINPAKILKLDKGVLEINKDADITIIDPNLEWQIDKAVFLSKSNNTPFHGKNVKGKVVCTIVSGKVVYK